MNSKNLFIENVIPIFFSCDDNYIPFLSVTLQSLEENASKNYQYEIKILHSNAINTDNQQRITSQYSKNNFNIEFVDITNFIEEVSNKLHTRDYYSKSTYYRLFIPNLYPQYDKALYLDSDIVVLGDISKLYSIDLKDNYVGAITDEAVQNVQEFRDYVENRIGVSQSQKYFNAGILLMNLKKLREINFQNIFINMLSAIKFNVAQDQDYLNAICRNHVTRVGPAWNKMPLPHKSLTPSDLKLIHYNLDMKPWLKDNVLYENYFWNYAKKCNYYHEIMNLKEKAQTMKCHKATDQTINLIHEAKIQADDYKENQKIFKLIGEICHNS